MAYTRVLEIAERLDDAEYRLRALWGLWASHAAGGRLRVALELAQRFHALAAERPDPNDRLSGEGIIGISQLYLGDLPSARRHLEHRSAPETRPGSRITGSPLTRDMSRHDIEIAVRQRTAIHDLRVPEETMTSPYLDHVRSTRKIQSPTPRPSAVLARKRRR